MRYIFNCTEKDFSAFRLFYLHLPLGFCCCVVYTALLCTNDLLFDLFLPLSPPSRFVDLWYIHPSFLPFLFFFFFSLCCVTMASCYEAVNVNDPEWSCMVPTVSFSPAEDWLVLTTLAEPSLPCFLLLQRSDVIISHQRREGKSLKERKRVRRGWRELSRQRLQKRECVQCYKDIRLYNSTQRATVSSTIDLASLSSNSLSLSFHPSLSLLLPSFLTLSLSLSLTIHSSNALVSASVCCRRSLCDPFGR